MTARRYVAMFEALARRGEGAFIPFVILGDPDFDTSAQILDALAASDADAVELGIPFSDPVADGPIIQAAAVRALAAGTTPDTCWRLVRRFRDQAPAVPIGILTYTNLALQAGPERFYRDAALAGADSVLLADLGSEEAKPFAAIARAEGVAPVMIVPPNATPNRLATLAALSDGYCYVTRRPGVTGANADAANSTAGLIRDLRRLGAAPSVLGFGIGEPSHVRAALNLGAVGAISGSALVKRLAVAGPAEVRETTIAFVREMKAATRASGDCRASPKA